jgi:hypothetical protein
MMVVFLPPAWREARTRATDTPHTEAIRIAKSRSR